MAFARVRCIPAAVCLTLVTASGAAQVFGTFTWQMQPYCNKVTLTLTSVASGFGRLG